MERKSIAIAVFWILSLGFGLGFVVFSTETKIEGYSKLPPFRKEAYVNPEKLRYLFDGNSNTVWEKLDENFLPWDLNLELGLSHIWNGTTFVPSGWNSLSIDGCPQSAGYLVDYSIFLRESINVDKELRMPNDTEIQSGQFVLKSGSTLLSLTELMPKKNESQYPNGISIVGIKLKLPKNSCLSELHLNR